MAIPLPFTKTEFEEIAWGWELCAEAREGRYTAGVTARQINRNVLTGIEIVNGKLDEREEDVILSQMMNSAAINYMFVGKLHKAVELDDAETTFTLLRNAIRRIAHMGVGVT